MSQEPTSPTLQVTDDRSGLRVRLTGCTRLTEVNIDDVGQQLTDLIASRERLHLSLDLAEIEYLTSDALAKFVAVNGKLRSSGGRLTIVNVQPNVREVFAVSHLDRVLDVRVIGEADPS